MLYTEYLSDKPSEIIVAVHKNLRRLFQEQLHLFLQFCERVDYYDIHFLFIFLEVQVHLGARVIQLYLGSV